MGVGGRRGSREDGIKYVFVVVKGLRVRFLFFGVDRGVFIRFRWEGVGETRGGCRGLLRVLGRKEV